MNRTAVRPRPAATCAFAVPLFASIVGAQDATSAQASSAEQPEAQGMSPEEHARMAGPAHEAMHGGSMMTDPTGLPRSRYGSGTAWLPDSSPMYGVMAPLGAGGVMLHENIFVGYDRFGSDRGSELFLSVNSVMGMAWYPVGPGELTTRAMLSAEPLTVGKRGYPLILQSGETANGEPLHDRQHPHDLFMELALAYTTPLSPDVGLQVYAAPAGEPALGPVAYPHRISAISDPLAPIGHHWEDATHISFGVLTVGFFTRQVKLEGSWFNGREPNENRWNIDLRVPDSYSGRLSWNPTTNWSVQGSYGYLKSPEEREPSLSVHRVTASATYNRRAGAEANWATTLVFGENIESEGPATPAFLLESNCNLDGHHVLFGRTEYVRKTGQDLVLSETIDRRAFNVGNVGAGYVYYFGPFAALSPGVGVRASLSFVDSEIESFYGTRFPIGWMVFAQLRPAAMQM